MSQYIQMLDKVMLKTIHVDDVADSDIDDLMEEIEYMVKMHSHLCRVKCLDRCTIEIVRVNTRRADHIEMKRLKAVEESMKLIGSYFSGGKH